MNKSSRYMAIASALMLLLMIILLMLSYQTFRRIVPVMRLELDMASEQLKIIEQHKQSLSAQYHLSIVAQATISHAEQTVVINTVDTNYSAFDARFKTQALKTGALVYFGSALPSDQIKWGNRYYTIVKGHSQTPLGQWIKSIDNMYYTLTDRDSQPMAQRYWVLISSKDDAHPIFLKEKFLHHLKTLAPNVAFNARQIQADYLSHTLLSEMHRWPQLIATIVALFGFITWLYRRIRAFIVYIERALQGVYLKQLLQNQTVAILEHAVIIMILTVISTLLLAYIGRYQLVLPASYLPERYIFDLANAPLLNGTPLPQAGIVYYADLMRVLYKIVISCIVGTATFTVVLSICFLKKRGKHELYKTTKCR